MRINGSAARDGHPGIRRVVAGVDGSDGALHAALWAAREARCLGVPLLISYAMHLRDATVPPIEPADFAVRRLREGGELVSGVAAQVMDQYPDVAVQVETSPLTPVHRLVDLSARDVLVVVGTRGHGGFVGMLLGSVSRALALHAKGPLAVVRGGPEPESACGPVVLGVGLNLNDSAIEFAFAAARRYAAPLRVVRAWVPPMPLAGLGLPGAAAMGMAGGPGLLAPAELDDSDENEAQDAARAIEPFVARYQDVETEIVARVGNAVPVLNDECARTRLIVVGAHRRHGPFSVGAGYVVEGLLAHSPVPVAVIPIPPPA